MRDGFIKVAAGVPAVTVADVAANLEQIKNLIDRADEEHIHLLALPELCLTGYTCSDLFLTDSLLSAAKKGLEDLAAYTRGKYSVTVVGVPLLYNAKLYNCAAALFDGEIIGVVPKTHLPNYGEFYEKRQFTGAEALAGGEVLFLADKPVPFGNDLIFCHEKIGEYTFGLELCEDAWVVAPPSERLALCGAAIILNPSASNELIGKAEYRRLLIKATSARLLAGYVLASASVGESTQDAVYGGHCLIAENGTLLAENEPFAGRDMTVSEIDVLRLAGERRKNTDFLPRGGGRRIVFDQKITKTVLTRAFSPAPFVPAEEKDLEKRAEFILQIQSYGLRKRMEHTKADAAVIGVSGGLDSTLALLVAVRTMRLLGREADNIQAITMPCFGTTKRTRSNSETLCRLLGVSFREINIAAAVEQHFADIGQDPARQDVTFENAQARERTQVLMDVANQINGLVVGTGDLSELALGWATYNGDHMSMYGVNASVPKTLVRYLVRYEAKRSGGEIEAVLNDILNTPVSPELLPAKENGEIAQKTEDLVGPYELHDFFLYHFLRFGESPKKIFRLALSAFAGAYPPETVLQWLKVFTRRFFSQQFKRSCLPDGPKVGTVSLSPRGDWRQPSDAAARVWLQELEEIEV